MLAVLYVTSVVGFSIVRAETLHAGAATPEAEKALRVYPGQHFINLSVLVTCLSLTRCPCLGLFHEVVNEFEREGYTADDDVISFLQRRVEQFQAVTGSPIETKNIEDGTDVIDAE